MICVSVIVPMYNAGEYLSDFFETLINQTLRDIEIIIIDDCSTDSSLEIASSYADKDNRIRVIKNDKNMGAGKSRNCGIEIAKGEYLAFFDADDYLSLDLLETVYWYCKRKKANLGIFDYATYDQATGCTKRHILPFDHPKVVHGEPFDFNDIVEYAFQLFDFGPVMKLYERNFILEKAIRFQDLKNCNDVYFSGAVLILSDCTVYVPTKEPLYFYRVNTNNQISSTRYMNPHCIWTALTSIKSVLQKVGHIDKSQKSFNSCAVDNLYYLLKTTPLKNVDSVREQILLNGFKALGIEHSTLEDFLSCYDYERYNYLQSDAFNLAQITPNFNVLKANNTDVIKLVDYLKRNFKHTALWGLGLNGKQLLRVFSENGYQPDYLVDESQLLQGQTYNEIKIESFERVYERLDCVIITNSKYQAEILKKIKTYYRNIPVIDAAKLIYFGISVEDVLFKDEG